MPEAPPIEVLHLSLVTGGALRDVNGEKLGRVEDLIVRLGEPGYPPITGLLVSVAGRRAYMPAERVATIAPGSVTLRVAKLDLTAFERRPEEVLLKGDVLDRQLINVDGARLVRANEIELARVGGWWRVVGVDTGPRGAIRRLLPRAVAGRVGAGEFLSWASVEPFVGHVPSVKLSVPHPRLARLHPAQIADLVEAASHAEGEEILEALGSDRELEADVFEELDEQHQAEFVLDRSDADVAELLSRMSPDDAADFVAELDEDRREAVLDGLPAQHRTKVRALLGFDPATAGGLMTTDFICLYRQATAAETLERVRASGLPAELLATVFVMDARRRLVGTVPVVELLRSDPGADLASIMIAPRTATAELELPEIARIMADFNLLALAVVGADEQMVGVVTVDDVLEVLLPKGWRRRFGVLGDD